MHPIHGLFVMFVWQPAMRARQAAGDELKAIVGKGARGGGGGQLGGTDGSDQALPVGGGGWLGDPTGQHCPQPIRHSVALHGVRVVSLLAQE